jgi:hypothetical protein
LSFFYSKVIAHDGTGNGDSVSAKQGIVDGFYCALVFLANLPKRAEIINAISSD